MIVLNQYEVKEVSGGIIPVGVAIVAVRVVQIATPYVQAGIAAAVGSMAYNAGYDAAM